MEEKKLSKEKVKIFILDIISFINIVDVNKSIVEQALKSEFNDFEDAVQNFSAKKAGCSLIITRNKKDYNSSTLQILTPIQFLENVSMK